MRKCPSWIAEVRACGDPPPRRSAKADELRALGLPSAGGPVVKVVEALELSDSRLKWLDLSGLELALPLVERLGVALGHTQVLEQLFLVGCGLKDKAVSAVALGAASCRQLKTLAVGENKFGNAGLVSLARMLEKSDLRSFSAAGMPIQDAAGYVLFNSLVHNRSLRRLDLARTALGPAAIPWVALLIRNTATLQVIDLRGIAVVASAAEELAAACAEAGFELAEKSKAPRRVLLGAPVAEPENADPLFAPPAVRRLLGGADGEPCLLTRSCAQFKPGPKRPPDAESLRRRAAAQRPPRVDRRRPRPRSAGPRMVVTIPGAGEQNARRDIEAAKTRERAQDCGAFDVPGFYGLCRRRFRNTVRAWRCALDPESSGHVGFRDFCVAARNLGYQGGLRELFKGLGKGASHITLALFDPAAAAELQLLRHELLAAVADQLVPQGKVIEDLDDVTRACFDYIDTNASGSLTAEEFRAVCAARLPGFDGNADRVFQYLDLSPLGDGLITVDEFAFLEFPSNAEYRSARLSARSSAQETPASDREASPASSPASVRHRGKSPRPASAEAVPGARGWRMLNAEIRARYGWVAVFREAGGGSMTSASFVQVVGKLALAWEGPFYQAFRASPQQHGRLYLGDVAPREAALLEAFRVWVGRRHTLHELAAVLRLQPIGATEADFANRCRDALGIEEDQAAAVFRALGRVNYGALAFVYAGPFRRG